MNDTSGTGTVSLSIKCEYEVVLYEHYSSNVYAGLHDMSVINSSLDIFHSTESLFGYRGMKGKREVFVSEEELSNNERVLARSCSDDGARSDID